MQFHCYYFFLRDYWSRIVLKTLHDRFRANEMGNSSDSDAVTGDILLAS